MTKRPVAAVADERPTQHPGNGLSPDVYCGLENQFSLTRSIPWAEMQDLVEQFTTGLDVALEHFLLNKQALSGAAQRAIRPLKRASFDSPALFYIEVISPLTPERHNVAGRYCSTPALKKALVDRGLLEGYVAKGTVHTPAWEVVNEPFSVQQELARAVIGRDISHATWAPPASPMHQLTSQRLRQTLAQHDSTAPFLNALLAPVLDWLGDPKRGGDRNTHQAEDDRPLSITWFAAWLAKRELLLFPLSIIGREAEIFPHRIRGLAQAAVERPDATNDERQYEAQVSSLVRTAGNPVERTGLLVRALDLFSHGASRGKTNARLLAHLRASTYCSNLLYTVTALVWQVEA